MTVDTSRLKVPRQARLISSDVDFCVLSKRFPRLSHTRDLTMINICRVSKRLNEFPLHCRSTRSSHFLFISYIYMLYLCLLLHLIRLPTAGNFHFEIGEAVYQINPTCYIYHFSRELREAWSNITRMRDYDAIETITTSTFVVQEGSRFDNTNW